MFSINVSNFGNDLHVLKYGVLFLVIAVITWLTSSTEFKVTNIAKEGDHIFDVIQLSMLVSDSMDNNSIVYADSKQGNDSIEHIGEVDKKLIKSGLLLFESYFDHHPDRVSILRGNVNIKLYAGDRFVGEYTSILKISSKIQLKNLLIVSVPEGVTHIEVRAYSSSRDALKIDQIRVFNVVENPAYTIVKAFVLLGWVVFAAYILKVLNSNGFDYFGSLIAVLILLIIAATTLSKSIIRTLLVPLHKSVESTVSTEYAPSFVSFLDVGHVFMFALLAFFLGKYAEKCKLTFVSVVFISLVVAIISESLQRYSFSRSSGVHDLALNTLGCFIGLSLYSLLNKVIRKTN